MAAGKLTPPNLVVSTNNSTSPLEQISDFLDHLPLPQFVEVTPRLLTSISSLPTRAARPHPRLNTVIISWPNMAARPLRTEQSKVPRLACWNGDELRSRKLELEHILSQQVVDICLLGETIPAPGKAFRFANYVCQRTARPTAWSGTAILVCHGIFHHSVPSIDVTHLEGTAIKVTLAGKPVIVLAAYLSPYRPLIGEDMTACFGWWLPVLMAGVLNAKHVECNSRLRTRQGKCYVFLPARTV